MSKDKLLAAGLLFSVLLIFIAVLSVVRRRKPKDPYAIEGKEGALRVRGSKQVVIYYLGVATLALFINLLSIVLGIVTFWPLSKYQWTGIAILGTVGLVAYAIFFYLILRKKQEKWDFDYVFDRGRDRFFRGDTMVSAVSNIKNL